MGYLNIYCSLSIAATIKQISSEYAFFCRLLLWYWVAISLFCKILNLDFSVFVIKCMQTVHSVVLFGPCDMRILLQLSLLMSWLLFMLHWFRNWMYKVLVSNKVTVITIMNWYFYFMCICQVGLRLSGLKILKKKKRTRGTSLHLLAILPSPRKILATFQCSKFFFYGFLTWKDIIF